MNKFERKKGFTLIELLVVIVIMGILSTIGYRGYGKRAATAQLREDVSMVKGLMERAAAYTRKMRQGSSVSFEGQNVVVFSDTLCDANATPGDTIGEYTIRNKFAFAPRDPGLTSGAVDNGSDYFDGGTSGCVNFYAGQIGVNPVQNPEWIVIEGPYDLEGMVGKRSDENQFELFFKYSASGNWMRL